MDNRGTTLEQQLLDMKKEVEVSKVQILFEELVTLYKLMECDVMSEHLREMWDTFPKDVY
jgi:hypothetical protein